MPKQIDEKVVAIEFDNKRFEKNIEQTTNSVNKLNKSLQFKDAGKGFEEISDASRKVDMSPLEKGVEKVKLKFSALQTIATTALVNITNSAVNAGKSLVKSLSSDNIMAGWAKYEQKTSSVQTIMNSTGKSVDEVNEYLSKLMWYSDQTSYGFTDMTASLAQLTSAGGDIEKIIPMIEGIANATAFAGKGAAEFSRAIYNLNQSYSAGYLQYMDWKSLDLAGVSSKQLKQTLIDTAVELGKIQKGQVTLENFTSTLSDRWADTEVMEKGFAKFSAMAEKAYSLVKNNGMDIEDAMDQAAIGLDDISVKAFRAAQEYKSFSDVINATKDAVSSKWLETSEIIFGNYEEGKKIWSRLGEAFNDIFVSKLETRNSILQMALGSGWNSFMSDAVLYKEGFESHLKKLFGNKGLDINELINEKGSLEKVVQSALNDGTMSATDLSTALNKSVSELRNCTDEQLKELGLTREIVDAWELSSDVVDEYAKSISKLSGREMIIEGIANIGKSLLTIFEQIKVAWGEVFPSSTESKADSLYKSLSGFYSITEKLFNLISNNADGIKKVFVNIFTPIKWVANILKGLFNYIWPVIKTLIGMMWELAKIPLGWIQKLSELFNKVEKTEKSTSKLAQAMIKFKNALILLGDGFKLYISNIKKAIEESEFLNSLVEALKKIIEKVKEVWKVVQNFLSKFAKKIGETFKKADANTIIIILNAILTSGLLATLYKAFTKLSGSGPVGFIKTLRSLRDTLKSYQNSLNANVIKQIAISIGILSASLVAVSFIDSEKLWTSVKAISALIGAVSLMIIAIAKIGDTFSSGGSDAKDTAAKGIKNFLTNFGNGLGTGIKRFLSNIGTSRLLVAFGLAVLTLAGTLKFLTTIDWEKSKNAIWALVGIVASLTTAVVLINGLLTTVEDKVLAIHKTAKTFTDNSKVFTKGTSKGIAKTLLALTISVAAIAGVLKLLSTIDFDKAKPAIWSLIGIIGSLTIAVLLMNGLLKETRDITKDFKKTAKGFTDKSILSSKTTKGISKTLISLSIAVAAIAGVLKLLTTIDYEKAGPAIGTLAGILISLTVATIAINRLGQIDKNKKGIASLLFIVPAISIISGIIKMLSTIDISKYIPAIGTLVGVIVLLSASFLTITKITKKMDTKSVLKLCSSILMFSASVALIAGALIALTYYDWDRLLISSLFVIGMLGILIGSCILISKIPGAKEGILLSAGALTLLAVALNLLIAPVILLNSIKADDLKNTIAILGIMVVGLVALAGVLALISYIPGLKTGVLAISGSFALIGVAITLISGSLVLLSGGLSSLFLVLQMNKDNMYLLEELANTLFKLSPSIIAAGTGLILLGAGLLLVGSASVLLPYVIKNLNTFLEYISTFAQTLEETITKNTLKGAGLLAGLFGILVGVGYISLFLVPFTLAMVLVGLELQLFATTMQPFIDWLVTVPNGVVKNAATLTAVLGIMFGSSVIGVLSMVTSLSLSLVGLELQLFATTIQPFIDWLSTLPEGLAKKAGALTAVLSIMFGDSIIGILSMLTSWSLILVALELSGFMTNLQPFLDGLSKLPEGLAEKAGSLTAVLAIMFGDSIFNLLSMLTSWSLILVALELSSFMTNLQPFLDGLRTIDDDLVKKADNLNKILNKISVKGILSSLFKSKFNILDGIRSLFDGSMVSQPTIKPVMDLSDIISGAGTIDNLLNGNRSVGILSELGPINSSVNRIQNRRSDDGLLTAITDLNRSLQNNSGDTYNINGVTYDDGSAIQSAVETIVRAAILERRR